MTYESFYPREENTGLTEAKNQEKFRDYTDAVKRGLIPKAPDFVKMLPLYLSWILNDELKCITMPNDYQNYLDFFEKNSRAYTFCNFIFALDKTNPLSKDLKFFGSQFDPLKERFFSFCNKLKNYELILFFQHLKNFPFAAKLNRLLKRRKRSLQTPDEEKAFIIKLLLTHPSFKYLHYPSALFPFHLDAKGKKVVCPLQEQLKLFNHYKKCFKNAELLILVTDQIANDFDESLKQTLEDSKQNSKTDDLNYCILPTESGLKTSRSRLNTARCILNQLQQSDKDIIHISYVDDIEKSGNQLTRIKQRKILQGKLMLLIQEQERHFKSLSTPVPDVDQIKDCIGWLQNHFIDSCETTIAEKPLLEQKKLLLEFLQRPIRVCGVTPIADGHRFLPHLVEQECGQLTIDYLDKKELNKYFSSTKKTESVKEYLCLMELCCSLKSLKINNTAKYLPKPSEANCINKNKFWMEDLAWNTSLIEFPQSVFCSIKGLNDLLDQQHQ